MTPRTAGQSCDVTPDCSASTVNICGENLVCLPQGGSATCVSTTGRQLSLCGRTGDPDCPSGTDCVNLRIFSPALTRAVSVCAGRLAEGQRCVFALGDGGVATRTCELGFDCVARFCSRACASSSDCGCDAGAGACGPISDAGNRCAVCWAAGVADPSGRPLTCGVNAVCCDSVATACDSATGGCCRSTGTACTTNAQCCSGFNCVGGVCAACVGDNSTTACTSTGQCCVGQNLSCTIPLGASAGRCCRTGTAVCATGGACVDVTLPTRCGPNCTSCAQRANSTPRCVNLACRPNCTGNWGNCDGLEPNGCETNLLTSASHCSACGRACPTAPNGAASCSSGQCSITCNAGYTKCGNICVLTSSDTNNCGMCGRMCPTGSTCTSGVCTGGGTPTTCATEIPPYVPGQIPQSSSWSFCPGAGYCCRRQTNYPTFPATYTTYPCGQHTDGSWWCGVGGPS